MSEPAVAAAANMAALSLEHSASGHNASQANASGGGTPHDSASSPVSPAQHADPAPHTGVSPAGDGPAAVVTISIPLAEYRSLVEGNARSRYLEEAMDRMCQEHAAAAGAAATAAAGRKRPAPAGVADHAKRMKGPEGPIANLGGDDRKFITYPDTKKGAEITGECFSNNCSAKHRWQMCDKPEN